LDEKVPSAHTECLQKPGGLKKQGPRKRGMERRNKDRGDTMQERHETNRFSKAACSRKIRQYNVADTLKREGTAKN